MYHHVLSFVFIIIGTTLSQAQGIWTEYSLSNSSIPFEKIYSIDFDNSGNIWFGTNVTGATGHLCRFDGQTFYPESYNAWIYDIEIDKSGSVWVINCMNELKRWDGNDWETFTHNNLDWYSDPLFIDSKGIKWMNPGFGNEILTFDGSEWNNAVNELSYSRIYAIKEYQDKIYIASDSGLIIYNGQKWEKLMSGYSDLPNNKIYDIEVDNYDSLWLLCGEGFLVAHKDSTWNCYYSKDFEQNPFGLEIDGEDLWIGLYSQIVKFDKKNTIVFNSSNTNLPYNSIFCMEINNKSELWIGTRKGLFKYTEEIKPSIIIKQQPRSVILREGYSTAFSVIADGDSLHYQWYKNYQEIQGAMSYSYIINFLL